MKAILVLIAAIAFAISPFLNSEFGGFDPDRFPIPQDKPPVQPAGWAFAIWGVIYLGLIGHAVYGVSRHRDDPNWDAGRLALLISLGVGVAWLPIALVSPIWASVLIFLMLGTSLMSLYQMRSTRPRSIALWPVALYAGWLTAASFVSIGLIGAGYGIVFAEFGWAIVALCVAVVFALINIVRLKLWPYGIAVVWGLTGITAQNYGSEPMIAGLAGVAALLVGAVTVQQNSRR
jgi:hypothetical protein